MEEERKSGAMNGPRKASGQDDPYRAVGAKGGGGGMPINAQKGRITNNMP